MKKGIQDKTWDIRIFGHAVWINKRSNNNAKNGQQSISVTPGQIRNNIHG